MKSGFKKASLSDACISDVLAECRDVLEKRQFTEDDIDPYLESVASMLACYREHFGEDAEIKYRIRRRFGRIELRVALRGEKLDPLQQEMESNDTGQSVRRVLRPLVWDQVRSASYAYLAGVNIVSIASPHIRAQALHRSPMLWAAILGLACGLLSLLLPETARTVIVDGIAMPVQSAIIGVLTGVMGPVILFSMITAVSALKSINDLTDLGFKILFRFIVITLGAMAVGIAVSLMFYNVTGEGTTDLQAQQIVDLVLGIFPTNALTPLIENNVPQLVVLGIALGAALLMLENRVDGLKDLIAQAHQWVMSLMGIITIIGPAIPFLSIFTTIAKGSGADLLSGWEFIVAVYVATTICGVFKFVKVSTKYKVGPGVLWRKLRPVVGKAFVQTDDGTIMKMEYEIAERDLGIKPEFSSFWVPMSEALLNPRVAIMLVIPPFLILKYTGMPISAAFLLVLVIMVLELSIACPGTMASWTILFAALGFPSDYVGMFMVYKLACANYSSAYGALQSSLEHIEAADKFDAIDLDKLREEPAPA